MSVTRDAANASMDFLAERFYDGRVIADDETLDAFWHVAAYMFGETHIEETWPSEERARARLVNLETRRDARSEYMVLRDAEECFRCGAYTVRLDIDFAAPWCAQDQCAQLISEDLANEKEQPCGRSPTGSSPKVGRTVLNKRQEAVEQALVRARVRQPSSGAARTTQSRSGERMRWTPRSPSAGPAAPPF